MHAFDWNIKSTDGLDLFARGWEPEGKPKAMVCLVHGLGEHVGRYEHVAAALTAAGYVLLGFDLRGHGRSDGPRGHAPSEEQLLDDLRLFLTRCRGRYPGLKQVLYGHSLGAILSLYYAGKSGNDLAGVIVTAAAMHSAIEEQKAKKLLAQVLGSLAPGMAIDTGLVPATLSHDLQVVKEYIDDPLVHHKMTLGFAKIMMKINPGVFELAPRFPVPVLVMHGELDALGYPSGSQKFAGLVQGDCTLKVWIGMMHEIHNESDREQVFATMVNWLDGHLA